MMESSKSKTRYYWCVNCGHHGDYGKERQRGVKCEKCDYDDITPLDKEEFIEYTKRRNEPYKSID